jgi:hypothetical protein
MVGENREGERALILKVVDRFKTHEPNGLV